MKIIGVIGLGYVGLGLAVALSKKHTVIGCDISKTRIEELKNHTDKNGLFSGEELSESPIRYTDSISDVRDANFFIVTVSTPAWYYELPNLEPLINATRDLASILKKEDIVVYESTVYPGVTEDVCIPLLEEFSKLKNGIDFHVGYSPERINPNDRDHTLQNITKIISGQDEYTLDAVREIYQSICDTVHPVSNIKTAEAVKILENTQRDVNIAMMNEFAEIMHTMSLGMHEIIEAAKTKWSFLPFKPGLVGGHCIAVDPLYLAFQAKRKGVNPDLIMTARKVNDNITGFLIRELIKILLKNNISQENAKIGIFGITYKENIPDIRNSLALKFIKEMRNAEFSLQVHDPYAEKNTVSEKYHFQLQEFDEIHDLSVAIILVPHTYYREEGIRSFTGKFKEKAIVMDIPNLFIEDAPHCKNIQYWCL